MEPLLTTDEVAAWLRVEVVTVRRLIGRGDLLAYRIGNEYRFKTGDLEAFLERQRVNDGADGEGLGSSQGDQFTKRAYAALERARVEATRSGRRDVDAEDLLLGLMHDEENVAALALGALSITPVEVRRALKQEMEQDSDTAASQGGVIDAVGLMTRRLSERGASVQGIDLTARAHKVLRLAVDEALRIGRPMVGTGQLLLGLMREDAGATARALRTLGVPLDEIRQQMTRIVKAGQTTGD